MKKTRIALVTVALALITAFPATPVKAAHTCALDDISRELDTICENYHNPKPLLSYLICLVSPTCGRTASGLVGGAL